VLVSIFHGVFVASEFTEGNFNVFGPGENVNQESNLGRVTLDPFFFFDLTQLNKRLTSDLFKRGAHCVNDILHVGLDFAQKLEHCGKLNVLRTDVSVHTNGDRADTLVFKLEVLDSLENLGHVDLDLLGGTTVGQNIKQISWGNEVETGEGSTLALHELVKGLLANAEISLNLFEGREYPILVAINESI